MVLFELRVQCNFECIKLLYVNISEYEWCIKVKCTGCGEESPNWHSFSSQDSNPLKGGRGSANFLYKCKLCSRENSIDVIEDSLKKIAPATKADAFVPFVRFDCRGLEPIGFQPKATSRKEPEVTLLSSKQTLERIFVLQKRAVRYMEQWTAEAENSGAVFRDIDLSENDWADYDTNANETVGIYDFTSTFERVK